LNEGLLIQLHDGGESLIGGSLSENSRKAHKLSSYQAIKLESYQAGKLESLHER
jgi:hypothetical protein